MIIDKKEKKEEKTDFQGPVSLEAIIASKKGTPIDIEKPIVAKPIVEKPIVEKPIVEKPIVEKPIVGKPEDVIETPIAPAPIVNTGEETEFFKTAKNLISLNLLEDFAIQTSDEDAEGTLISEFTGMTEENLQEIIKIHQQEKKDNISSNYIPKEGLKEHQLKVIEILQSGGDLSQIADTPDKAFDRPFEGFDMEEQKSQIDVVYTDLVSGKGLDSESAISLIKAKVAKGTIEKDAKDIFDSYRTAHSKYIDETLEKERKKKEFKDLNFKENKKTLTAKYKEAGLKEGVYKKVASEYAKKNADGGYALVDKLKEALDNPEENHELILHLVDKKLFNETFRIKASNETQRTITRLASGVSLKGNKQGNTAKKEEGVAPWIKAANIHNENNKK